MAWFLALATLGLSSAGAPPVCSTLGPATLQNNTARIGGVVMATLSEVHTPTACAAACCAALGAGAAASPCRSWNLLPAGGPCQLLSGYSAPVAAAAAGTCSGVVYRPGAQSVAANHSAAFSRYGQLRGFNYVPPASNNDIDMWRDYDAAAVERDMAIAQAAGFDFCRVFLNFYVWDALRGAFLHHLAHFLGAAHARGIDVMPIAFDMCWFGCRDEVVSVNSSGRCWYPSPSYADADNSSWWAAAGEPYVDALIDAFPAGTPGLLLWDVVNEPESGGAGGRWDFVKHFVGYFRSRSATPTTVGVGSVCSLEEVGGLAAAVDVLSFHSYHSTWELGLQRTELALALGRQHAKPVFNSETGCIARANAFDQTMEQAARNGIGFAVWELMVSDCADCTDQRRYKHGLMYVDGTTRDPAAVAAVRGVYLNRGDNPVAPPAVPRPDVEGASTRTATAIDGWLRGGTGWAAPVPLYADGVALLDTAANLLEASGVAPHVNAISGVARQLSDHGDSAQSRAQLSTLLTAQVATLRATRGGAETGPGACQFPGTPEPAAACRRADGCRQWPDTNLTFFLYAPPSTATQRSCWTGVTGTPSVDGDDDGSLHYCNRAGANATFAVPAWTQAAAAAPYPRQQTTSPMCSTPMASVRPQGRLLPAQDPQVAQLGASVPTGTLAVELVFKRGPDCGMAAVYVDGTLALELDTYGPTVDWGATSMLAAALDAAVPHSFRIEVLGRRNPDSSDSWVQVSAVQAVVTV